MYYWLFLLSKHWTMLLLIWCHIQYVASPDVGKTCLAEVEEIMLSVTSDQFDILALFQARVLIMYRHDL